MARSDDAGPHPQPTAALVHAPVVMVVDDADPGSPAEEPARPHHATTDTADTWSAPVVMDVDGRPPSEGSTPTDRVRRPPWLVPTIVVVLVVLLALAGWSALDDDPSAPTEWSAPVAPVVERWHLEVPDAGDGLSQVVTIGEDVLLRRRRGRPGSSRRVVLERRDGRTGEVVWSTGGRPDALVVVLDGDRPLPRLLYPVDRVRAVVGVDGATGDRLWRQAGNDESWGGVTSTGELWLTGERGCGFAHAPTGRMLFTVGGDRREACAPAGEGLVVGNGDEQVVVDRTGTVVDRLTRSRGTQVTWPLVLDGATLFLDGRDLVAREPSGVERWRRDLGPRPTWWWMRPVGADLLHVAGERQTLLVDRGDGAVVARVEGQVDALVTADGRVRLVADRSRTSPAEASGVWSRSPDAADLALLDDRGEVLGTQALVVGSWPMPTAQGLLLVHGPDDRRRLSLFDPDDLSARWQLPLSLRDGEVVASSEALVVVQGVRDGRRQAVVFGPEG